MSAVVNNYIGTIQSVTWRNDPLGASGQAVSTLFGWIASNVPLAVGQNGVTYTATNSAGYVATDTLKIYFSPDGKGLSPQRLDLAQLLSSLGDLLAKLQSLF